jgi:hypothetical protein
MLAAPPVRGRPGYELFPGVGYYKFHTKSATWHQARSICEQEGSHLAIINSEAESKVLKEILAKFPKLENVTSNEAALIGFHDLYEEGQYLTIYGEYNHLFWQYTTKKLSNYSILKYVPFVSLSFIISGSAVAIRICQILM